MRSFILAPTPLNIKTCYNILCNNQMQYFWNHKFELNCLTLLMKFVLRITLLFWKYNQWKQYCINMIATQNIS